MLEFFCGRSLGVVVEVAHETLPWLAPTRCAAAESRNEGKSNSASKGTNDGAQGAEMRWIFDFTCGEDFFLFVFAGLVMGTCATSAAGYVAIGFEKISGSLVVDVAGSGEERFEDCTGRRCISLVWAKCDWN